MKDIFKIIKDIILEKKEREDNSELIIDFGKNSLDRIRIIDEFVESGEGNCKAWSDGGGRQEKYEYLAFVLESKGLHLYYSGSNPTAKEYHRSHNRALLIDHKDLGIKQTKYPKKKLEI